MHESKVHILLNHWSCSLSYHVSGINAEGECKKIIFFKSLILLYIENFSYYCSFDFWLYFNLFNHPIFLHVSVLLFFILSFHPLIFALQGKEKVAFPLSLSFSSFFSIAFLSIIFFNTYTVSFLLLGKEELSNSLSFSPFMKIKS